MEKFLNDNMDYLKEFTNNVSNEEDSDINKAEIKATEMINGLKIDNLNVSKDSPLSADEIKLLLTQAIPTIFNNMRQTEITDPNRNDFSGFIKNMMSSIFNESKKTLPNNEFLNTIDYNEIEKILDEVEVFKDKSKMEEIPVD